MWKRVVEVGVHQLELCIARCKKSLDALRPLYMESGIILFPFHIQYIRVHHLLPTLSFNEHGSALQTQN